MSSPGPVLEGRVAVVTGAARGIGAQLCRRLAQRGARVVLLGLEPAELAAVADECGPDAAWWEVDITDSAALAEVAASVQERYGRIDVLVANAGIAATGPLMMADAATFDRVIEVNLLGSVRTARAFLPALAATRGYYLQIASLAAITATPMMASYCASKSGVEAFAHSVAAEVEHLGVDVGVAYLSWVDTDLVRGADTVPGVADLRRKLPFPMNRTYPLEATVEKLVAGIERRSSHVYGQGWVRYLQLVRGSLPVIIATQAGKRSARAERILRDAPGDVTGLVGAGGAADTAARSVSSTRGS